MVNPRRDVLIAAAKVKFDNPEFVAYLKERLEKYRSDTIMQRDEVTLRWAQGRAQELSDIVEILENANALL